MVGLDTTLKMVVLCRPGVPEEKETDLLASFLSSPAPFGFDESKHMQPPSVCLSILGSQWLLPSLPSGRYLLHFSEQSTEFSSCGRRCYSTATAANPCWFPGSCSWKLAGTMAAVLEL